jgi:hypothetical protein
MAQGRTTLSSGFSAIVANQNQQVTSCKFANQDLEWRAFWCLFGVYYGRALERGEGIRETKEKSSQLRLHNDFLTNLLLTVT